MTALWIYLSVFGAFFILGVPVVVALGVAGIALLLTNQLSFFIFAQQWLMSTDNYSLTAIFFFMLAGEIMNTGGLTKRIVGLASKLVGKRPGGLAIIVGLGSMFFAAINGSAIATAAAMGSIMIPAMNDEGYAPEFSGAVVAAGGVVGPIIPPSIPMILYGTITGLSVAKLFAGGMFLGILIGITQFTISYFVSKKRGYTGSGKVYGTVHGSIWALLLPVFIFTTISFGVLTPTEASAFSVVYSLIISMWVYKEMSWKDLPKIIEKSFISTATVMAVVGAASVSAWILTSQQIPQKVAELIVSIVHTPTQFLLLSFFILILVGMVMDLTPAVLILAPVFIQPVAMLGVDPIHFGIIFVSVLVVGLITPPVGTLIYTSCSMTKRSFIQVSKELMPYTLASLAIILLSIFIPPIVTFIPSLIR
ncbi:TRAP transporter large permease [Anaerotruncus rubiinfantis]|uniref:TRAP transporter large permease n=1 Tax=Anaerotruncus rubiinfantis TaxID=1720200 RepID=UPI000829B594|nr:TRAP transporter large permease [Anaerotruncus rubiinfantis]